MLSCGGGIMTGVAAGTSMACGAMSSAWSVSTEILAAGPGGLMGSLVLQMLSRLGWICETLNTAVRQG